MSDLLAIGSSGIGAYQKALATVSNNIANANTDGYTRQDIAITSNEPIQTGNSYIGSGARFDQVRRQFDAFIEANLRNSNSDLQAQTPLLDYVNRLIDIMGDQNIGLTTAMNQFFQSARDLASDPASNVARSIFLRDADGLASRYRELATQLGLLQTESRQSVQTDVGQINAYTTQLAQINKQLTAKATEASQPSELLDQRDLLLRQLSGLIAIKTSVAPNGSVLVSVGDTIDQGVLVRGVNNRLLSAEQSSTDPNNLDFVIDAYGNPETVPPLTSGKISGTIQFREQVLQPALDALNDLAAQTVEQVNAIHTQGLDAEGKLGGALFGFSPGQENTAAGMQLLIKDSSRVAAAGQFRVINDALNASTAQASVSYSVPSYEGPTGLQGKLDIAQAPWVSSNQSVSIQSQLGFANLGLAPMGTTDLTLTLTNPTSAQSFQVLTRDGRQLAGTALNAGEQTLMLKTGQGMEAGATYDSSLIKQSGLVSDSYASSITPLNGGTAMTLSISDANSVLSSALTISVAAGADTPQGVVDAINNNNDAKTAGVTATLNSDYSISITGPLGSALSASATDVGGPVAGLQFTATRAYDAYLGADVFIGAKAGPTEVQQFNSADGSLLDPTLAPAELLGTSFDSTWAGPIAADTFTLNGVSLPELSHTGGGAITLSDVIDWIQQTSDDHSMGITASNDGGYLKLTASDTTTEIRLGLGSGTGADLKKLGFDTSLYISGKTPDDLLIFVTDRNIPANSTSTVQVSGQYLSIGGDLKQQLRDQTLKVTFVSDTEYQIYDTATNTLLAERTLDTSQPTPSLSYRGIQLRFSSLPQQGDTFTIDGNQDGIGNNEAMLQLVDLEKAGVMPGNQTLTAAYIERVNLIGNMAQQATISQQALQVVYKQAQQTRDGISGVNLDTEASNLVRFQQAYQANAKVMQIASTLFDTIMQVR